jgi:hypothetical protein
LIDYSAKSFTVSVNGVSQLVGGVGSSANFAFLVPTANTADINFSPTFDSAKLPGTWQASTIDNISLVPEPNAWALLTVSLCAGLFLRRRPRKFED